MTRTPASRSEIVKAAYKRPSAAGSHQTAAPWQKGLRCRACGGRVLVTYGFWAFPAGGQPYARHLDCEREETL